MSNNSDGKGFRQEIIKSLDDGCVLANYYSHGSVDFWASERIFTGEDASLLRNRNRYPFFTLVTCLNGAFHDAVTESLAERILKQNNRGGIAVWTPTGWIYISQYGAIGSNLYRSIFDDDDFEIGESVLQAKLDYLASDGLWDHFQMLTLFGDPALKLNVINSAAPVVRLHYEESALTEDEQFVGKRPIIEAEIFSTYAIDWPQTKIILDNDVIKFSDPIVSHFAQSDNLGEIVLKNEFDEGTHFLRLIVSDTTGLKGEDRISFSIRKDDFRFYNVLNYPNPMRDRTSFAYELSQSAEVTVKIYTIAGRLIRVLDDLSMRPSNALEWDGRDADGDRVANGVYFYKVIARNGEKTLEVINQ